MTNPFRAALPLAAGLSLALVLPALAEDGTPEQREACAPDAIRLCQDTIPDVARTTACMKRHEAELSPRCHRVFAAATPRDPDEASRPRRAARAAPRRDVAPRNEEAPREVRRAPRDDDDFGPDGRRYGYDPDDERFARSGLSPDDYGPRRYRYLAPNGDEAEGPGGPPRGNPDRAHARAEILRACDEEMLDPRTCEEADRALGR